MGSGSESGFQEGVGSVRLGGVGMMLEGNDPFGIRRFSLRRYTVRHLCYMLATFGVLAAVCWRLYGEVDWLTFGLAVSGAVLMALVFWVTLRATVRRVAVERWIRRLGMGDFEYTLAPSDGSEVSKMLVALEAVRQRALGAMQLDLVRSLSEELQEKNRSLESALTELERTQDRLVSQQKLGELHDLTAAIAHQLSNPMSMAVNFSEASADLVSDVGAELERRGGLDGVDGHVMRELLRDLSHSVERTKANCRRASKVVQEALRLGDARRGFYSLVDFNRLVSSQVTAVIEGPRWGGLASGVEVVCELDPGVGDVRLVPEDVATVVGHLVDNAMGAVSERRVRESGEGYRGVVRVETAREAAGIELVVRDNGVGIQDEVMPYIFNPFYSTGGGTGLGLSMGHEVVREHGGTLRVDSVAGEYTEVRITLPDAGGVDGDGVAGLDEEAAELPGFEALVQGAGL